MVEMALFGEEGVGTEAQLPHKCVKKTLNFKTNTGKLSHIGFLTRALNEHFINLLTPQPHVFL